MKHVTAEQARSQFEALLKAAEAGETVEIIQDGRVVARLEPANGPTGKIDIEALRQHQSRLTSPMQNTQSELEEWKSEYRY